MEQPSLMDMTLDKMQQGLQCGFFTSVELVQTYLKRIEEVNGVVKAITELDPTALDQAKTLDIERSHGHLRGL